MRKRRKLIPVLLLSLAAAGCSNAAADSCRQGIEAYQAGNYTKAIGLFGQAITQDGTKAEYYNKKGMAQCAAADYSGALSSFERALSVDAASAEAYRGMGLVYRKQGAYDQAIEQFDQALACIEKEADELRLDILAYRAEAKSILGDTDGAIADYQALLEQNYCPEETYRLLGDQYAKQKDVAKALITYQNVINLDYKNLSHYLQIAKMLGTCGFSEEKQMVLETALTVEAENGTMHYERGQIELELGDQKAAFSEFEQAYNMGCQEAGYYLGYCYELWEQYSEAELLYQKQLTVSPDDAGIYNQLAICKMKQEQYSEALVFLKRGISCADRDTLGDLLWNKAVCYEKLHQFSGAIEAMEQYVEQYPDSKSGIQELAYLKSR